MGLSVCAYTGFYQAEKKYEAIPFERVFHESTNIKEGGLDSCSGEFLVGMSGTYSVSWSSFSEANGSAVNLVLWHSYKAMVTETLTTLSLQGRTVQLDLEKGETLKLLHMDMNNNSLERLTFCISLVHAYDIKAAKAPKLKVLPSPSTVSGPTLTYDLQLTGTNDDLVERITNHFLQNHQN